MFYYLLIKVSCNGGWTGMDITKDIHAFTTLRNNSAAFSRHLKKTKRDSQDGTLLASQVRHGRPEGLHDDFLSERVYLSLAGRATGPTIQAMTMLMR